MSTQTLAETFIHTGTKYEFHGTPYTVKVGIPRTEGARVELTLWTRETEGPYAGELVIIERQSGTFEAMAELAVKLVKLYERVTPEVTVVT